MRRFRECRMANKTANESKSSWLSYGLPPQMLAKARHRLVQVLWVFVGLSSVGICVAMLGLIAGKGGNVGLAAFTHGTAIILSGSLLLLARRPSLSHELILNLGLVFQVLVCAVISLTTPVLIFTVFHSIPPLTWVAPAALLFTLMVPGPPRRMLVASILSCAMPPICMSILRATNHVTFTNEQLMAVIIGHAFIVPLAYMGARIMYRMSTEVAEARQIGSYTLIAKIGEGGMGEVWRGQHEMLARPAAIKLIRNVDMGGSAGDDNVALQRFEREAQVTASLESLHTVNVYDFGTSNDGQVYYVMELLTGLDLERLVSEFEPVRPARAVHFLKQICESLEEAHKAGVVHRDIKPANILTCRYAGHVDVIKVLDFGLASLRKVDAPSPNLTHQDAVIGTPSYMPPEQIKDGDAVTPQSDIYNLGCVAYWLLTGKPLFGGSSAVEVLAAHLHEPPPPPSELAEGIPKQLDDIVVSCLAKSPDDRPDGAGAVRALLEQVPCEPWQRNDASEWWERHRSRLL